MADNCRFHKIAILKNPYPFRITLFQDHNRNGNSVTGRRHRYRKEENKWARKKS